jgi:GTP cyclohydrolase II
MPIPKPSPDEILHARSGNGHGKLGPEDVSIAAVAELPTRFGNFHMVAFQSGDGKEHAALIRGEVAGKENVPVRLHSECLTGDVFTSLRCDCREQLEWAIKEIDQLGWGVILYLRQEGRGIGFANKIRAYQLQERGYDTNEANEALGFKADERDYEVAAHMLKALAVPSVRLMSNNPDKARDLREHGVRVVGRIPVVIPPTPYNERYLETKRVKSGHLLPVVTISEQIDCFRRGSNEQPRATTSP